MADSSPGPADPTLDEGIVGLSPDETRALGVVEAALFGTPQPQVQLERYELRERIGSGGAGSVWTAWDPELARIVAVKLLTHAPRRGDEESEARRRLQREARAVAKLSHPNVVTVFDVGEYDTGDGRKGTFVVMEHVDGADASRWLRREQRSARAILDVFVQAARGITAAHAAGLVHRDLKPSNLLMGAGGSVKVADFGLAALMDRPEDRSSIGGSISSDPDEEIGDTSRLTRSGTIMGTPHYMSPEQHRGETLDPRTDQFSFGVSLYEALYRHRPYTGSTLAELAESKAKGPPPMGAIPGVPARVRRAITRMLQADPEQRFHDMQQVLDILSPSTTRRTLVAVVLAGGLAAIGGALSMKALAGPRCVDVDAMSDTLWGPEQRDAVRAAFEATEKPFATAAFDATDASMLEHVDTWARLRRAACEREDPQVSSVQGACLDRRYEELLQLAKALREADGGVAERAPAAAAQYGQLEDCLDESAELVSFSQTAVGRDATKRLAEAKVAQRLGDAVHAREAALSGLSLLEQGTDATPGLEVVRSGLLSVASHAEFKMGNYEQSRASAHRAWVAAERAGDDRAVVAALDLWLRLSLEPGPPPAHFDERFEIFEAKGLRILGARFEPMRRWIEAKHLFKQGRYAEAAAIYEAIAQQRVQQAGQSGLTVATASSSAAESWIAAGSLDRARPLLEQAERITLEVLGDQHPQYALALANRADLEIGVGNHEAAAALQRQAIAILERAHPYDVNLAIQRTNYANSLLHMHDYEAAFENHETALPTLVEKLGPTHNAVALTLNNAAAALLELGRVEPARERLQKAQAVFKANDPPHPDYGMVLANLGVAALLERDHEAARRVYEQAMSFTEQALSSDHPRLLPAVWGTAETAVRSGDEPTAQALLSRGRTLADRAGDTVMAARLDAIEARLSSTPPHRARMLARRALPALREARSAVDDIEQLERIAAGDRK